MNIRALAFLCVSLAIVLSGCTKPPVMVETVFVLNATDGMVTEVTVLHEPTMRFGAVNAIFAGKMLELGLASGGQPLLARQALVHWRDAGGREWSVRLDLPYDAVAAKEDRPLTLVYEIQPAGRAKVQLRE